MGQLLLREALQLAIAPDVLAKELHHVHLRGVAANSYCGLYTNRVILAWAARVRRLDWGEIMRLCSFAIAVLTLAGCSGIQASAEQIEAAKEQCVELNREAGASYVSAGDTWKKEGKLVIEVRERESQISTSYRQRLCVVDFEGGTVELPSVFEQGRWDK